MRFQPGMIGVITGAGGGFGREMSLILAKKGMHLGLSDVDMVGLEETANLCREAAKSAGFLDCKVLTVRCDVSKSQEVFDFAAAVRKELAQDGRIDFVAANAGIAASANSWVDEPLEITEKVIQINVFGVLYTSKAFLPMLQAQKRGSSLLLLSSLAGVLPAPSMTSYCTSKYGVRGFGESLMREMKKNSPHVLVTVVHPGFCTTNIWQTMDISIKEEVGQAAPQGNLLMKFLNGTATREEMSSLLVPHASHTAKSASEAMVRGVERGATRLLLTPEAHFFDFAVRVAPRLALTEVGGALTGVFAFVAKCLAPFTFLARPGVPTLGVDRAIFLAGIAAAVIAMLRRSRLRL